MLIINCLNKMQNIKHLLFNAQVYAVEGGV